jgi:hypothetical protein
MNAIKKIFLTERSYLAVCILLGAIQAWLFRYTMISDGVSYLDIADAYLRRDWHAALNGYWSPLYSWCLGLALFLLKPSIWWEFITVHAVNFILYIAALFCFRFFLHSVLRAIQEDSPSDDSLPLSDELLLPLGYSVFLWASLILIEVGRVTPDMLVAALFFLIAGLLVQLRLQSSYGKFALFGALCGVAYLGKGVMFPLGVCLLALLLFSGKITPSRFSGVLLAALAFLIVSSPFILALSHAKGRLTFGDTGRIAYAAMVSPGTPLIHWQGDPAGSGTPAHPTRKLMDDPPVFEFAAPIQGAYPPWDDPSYWNEGMKSTFHLRSQLRVLLFGLLSYERFLLVESGLVAGLLVFLFLGGKPTLRAIAEQWPLILAAALSLGAYALVLVVNRYVGASMVLLFVAIFAGIRLPKGPNTDSAVKDSAARYLTAAIVLSVLFTVAGHLVENAYTTLTVTEDAPAKDQIKAALALQNLGLQAGDKVSVIGYGYLDHWARAGRFKIIAEVASPGLPARSFWASSPDRRDAAYASLSRTGAKAVIAWDPPQIALDSRWVRLSTTNYYAYFFHK